MQAIRQIGDRLDGKCATIERGDVPVEALSDAELFAIIRGEPFAHSDETSQRLISPPLATKQHARGYAVVPSRLCKNEIAKSIT